ncbi:MAG TPA: glycine--tRNA ligase subunit beta [Sinorhizobium sp.]|nr:glycine--tRNA ligase subunit beta [Sinorhizobium sp.]
MPELLLELFSEEIPARMQARAAEDFRRLFEERLKAASLSFERMRAFVTPRRLTLVVDGLPSKQPDIHEEKKGPRVGAPESAVHGFLKSVGLSSLDQCEKRIVGKAEFWFAKIRRKSSETDNVISDILWELIPNFPWPKSMRWGGNQVQWVRPIDSLLAMLNGKVIPHTTYLKHVNGVPTAVYNINPDPEFSPLTARDTIRGHRFLAPEPVAVKDFADYQAKLRERFVIVDQNERRETIRRKVEEAAHAEGLKVKDDPALLDEVTGLVEWPVALIGNIGEAFMDLPPEVLTTTMRANQKYFSLVDTAGALAPRFVVVANIDGDAETRANVVRGNERVLRARLSDANFFWDQDRKTKLEDRVPALASRVFHAKLGTMADKVARLQTLAAELAPYVEADVDHVRSAALLCKADLSTGMVGEFPELQGVMGRYYALNEGEKPEVADAIRDHYSPLGPGDRCPSAPVSVAIALADKIDSLVGFFAIGERPTGSRDPYALRRAALGLIRLILENKLRLPLWAIFAKADQIYAQSRHDWHHPEVPLELLEFVADRLKVALRDRGVRHDLIDAVFALESEDDLLRLLSRVDALTGFLGGEDGANLLTAYRRASNIVAIEEKKDKKTYDDAVDLAAFAQDEERTLHSALEKASEAMHAAIAKEDFVGAMRELSALRPAVDRFFDKVTVNTDDARQRANRLRLLSEIRRTLGQVAEFARIEG